MSGFILAAYAVFFTGLFALGLYLWLDRRQIAARLRRLENHTDNAS